MLAVVVALAGTLTWGIRARVNHYAAEDAKNDFHRLFGVRTCVRVGRGGCGLARAGGG